MAERAPKRDPNPEKWKAEEEIEEKTSELPNLTLAYQKYKRASQEQQKKALNKYLIKEVHEKFDAMSPAREEPFTPERLEDILKDVPPHPNLEEVDVSKDAIKQAYVPEIDEDITERLGAPITFEEALARIPEDFDASVLSEDTLMYLSWDTNQHLDRQLLIGLAECDVHIDLERTLTINLPIRASQVVNGEKRSLTLTIPQAAALLRAYADKGEQNARRTHT